MYEPEAEVSGRAEISKVAGKMLDQFGPTFAFTPDGVAVGHHGLARFTGTDAAEIVDEKIARLCVLIDSPPR